jgi:hypothetical protein
MPSLRRSLACRRQRRGNHQAPFGFRLDRSREAESAILDLGHGQEDVGVAVGAVAAPRKGVDGEVGDHPAQVLIVETLSPSSKTEFLSMTTFRIPAQTRTRSVKSSIA